ncbi:DUF6933 domain-containing protein [Aneurinibacillus sp. REN35]|uniref:DUF6933 domain-containing protein n=1 Tax=Aneurinibacillus sp. REN35 TaxID=3237286 RepID=UPI0035283729
MLTIQCTKKLSEELNVNISENKLVHTNPLYSWHAHLFLWNRRKCVLVMNNKTRYNFVLFGLRKDDFKRFDDIVVQAIAENLSADGANKVNIEKYIQNCHEVSYAATSDRSIISQVNEMIMAAKHSMEQDKLDGIEVKSYELNRWLNRYVMMKLPKLYSGETMLEELLNDNV